MMAQQERTAQLAVRSLLSQSLYDRRWSSFKICMCLREWKTGKLKKEHFLTYFKSTELNLCGLGQINLLRHHTYISYGPNTLNKLCVVQEDRSTDI